MLADMDVRLRRGLALTFALLFAIVAPLSIAYGRGYRFDFTQQRFSLTGVIVISGFPKRLYASFDAEPFREIALPHSIRGVIPGDHTLRIQHPDYTPQTVSLSIRPGETYFLDNLQLIRSPIAKTLRTGLPPGTTLAPNGESVAWRTGATVNIALPTGSPIAHTVIGAERIAWSTDGSLLHVYGSTANLLAQFSPRGALVLEPPDAIFLQQLQERVGSSTPLTSVQRMPDQHGWLVVVAGAAWAVFDDVSTPPELLSRWSEPQTSIVHLGRYVTAIVRSAGMTLRNAITGHAQFIPLPNTLQVAATRTPGVLHVLTVDGDLVQWQELQLF